MIITKTPLRITFAGGGSDMASYYLRHPAVCISATINKYVYGVFIVVLFCLFSVFSVFIMFFLCFHCVFICLTIQLMGKDDIHLRKNNQQGRHSGQG